MEEKRIPCSKCSRPTKEKDFLWAGKRKTGERHRQKVCKFCMLTKRTNKKRENRFFDKAKNAVYSHCQRWNQKNQTSLTPKQFMRRFHWPSYYEIAKRMETEYSVGCTICNEPYLDRNDMTIDIQNPDCPPYWSNVGFMCDTKNKQKQGLNLAEFEEDNEEWRQWREWISRKEQLKFGELLDNQYMLI